MSAEQTLHCNQHQRHTTRRVHPGCQMEGGVGGCEFGGRQAGRRQTGSCCGGGVGTASCCGAVNFLSFCGLALCYDSAGQHGQMGVRAVFQSGWI
ncbi:hypothetical protein BaRGS_00040374 [Batillaria attramentaria]|uniref:Uncharacterized protein n=1 Tax=Batillaria attramentaria TaxID=370345 RepID=A0ABD0J0V0_9CAEN